ncbi:LAMI_0B02300g1_1 [Lachancea mirantina]|uniref:LAMI_0B02300g1_1 n=1 Tax=Lachancea mirantina TaxID=1230905 RepID=A0A1G4IUI5_9SACH|nr:LAMI_0B02300g1_1 [Lachancea mirantina]
MNFLFKSLSNFQFPYALETEPAFSSPFYCANQGTKKADSTPVTVFTYSKQNNGPEANEMVANVAKMSKILKIPGLARVIDVIDTDQSNTYIVTERVHAVKLEQLSRDAISLGLIQLTRTLDILHTQAEVVLATLSQGSIVVNERGEWRIFGLELCCKKTQQFHFERCNSAYRSAMGGTSFEIQHAAFSTIDSVLLSGLISRLYSPLPGHLRQMVSGLGRGSMSIAQACQKLQATLESPLLTIYDILVELPLKDHQGKLVCMTDLQRQVSENADTLRKASSQFIDGLLIPEISQCLSTLVTTLQSQPMSAGVSIIVPFLAIIFDLTCSHQPASTSPAAFEKYVKPLIFENFRLPDRQLRFLLLVYFSGYIKKLSNSEVSTEIFPRFIQGLSDSDPTVRIQTLKHIPAIISVITERQLNNDLLRLLAKTQVDADPEIRTWTILIICKMSSLLSASSNRSGILATAFTKSLKDPHLKPRLAALYGLEKSLPLFEPNTIADKILTVIAPSLLDRNLQVRSKAKILFKLYSSALEEEAQKIPSDNSEKIEIDFDAELNDKDVSLVQSFLGNLKLSSPPAEVLATRSSPNVTVSEKTTDDWDNGDNEDDWFGEPVNGVSKNAIITEGSSISNIDSSAFKSTEVKITKSWNDDLNDDDWDNAWDEPKNINSTIKKSSQSIGTIRPKQSIEPQDDEEEEDGWDAAW